MNATTYPYLPEGRTFLFAPGDNPFMQEAREYALEHSLDDAVKTGSIIVKNGLVIGRGANGSDYHKSHECERVKRGVETGEGYELCEGCHPNNHSEPRAIANAKENNEDTRGADLYLWGHWWICKPCWDAISEDGIANVYITEGSDRLFNRASPENILGHWNDSV